MPHLFGFKGKRSGFAASALKSPMTLIPLPVRSRLARVGDRLRRRFPLLKRTPSRATWIEWAARVGFGARGFVYFSAGALTLLGLLGLAGDAVGAGGALAWLVGMPMGRLWLVLVIAGLAAFVMWRMLQAVFDADHEGKDRHGLMTRAAQLFSGLGYVAMAAGALGLLTDKPEDASAEGVAASRDAAQAVMAMPWGEWLLTGAGLAILGIGVANVVRAWREDFTQYLSCSEHLCRRVEPLARAGYVARGLAYLPLGAIVLLAGLRAEPADVTTLGAALEAVERQPAGPWALAATALGLMAFGVFSFVEARWRRIRPPREVTS